jgi:hypothetical protein
VCDAGRCGSLCDGRGLSLCNSGCNFEPNSRPHDYPLLWPQERLLIYNGPD